LKALLQVEDVDASYGASQVLFGMSLEVGACEAVTLIGRNGMGKSSTVKTIVGQLPPRRGTVHLAGESIAGRAAHYAAQAGIGLVPEGRQVFPNLTVRENLLATAADRHKASRPWTLERAYDMFPRLKQRERNLGSNLSGGEQQMLAIARALMTNPKLLILDEATEGLAPLIRADIWRCIHRLKAEGLALIVIDKHLDPMLRLADRHYVVAKGRVVWSGTSNDLSREPAVLHEHVGV